MKILLDECLPLDFRHSFANYQTHTAEWAGLKGMKNGALLRAAVDLGYDVFLTVDQGIPHQQPAGLKLSVLLIRTPTNQLEDLTPLAHAIQDALRTIQPGQIVTVPAT